MKKFTFLEFANALRWMHDNTTGKIFLINFFKYDLVIIKREETSSTLHKRIDTQSVKINQMGRQLTQLRIDLW
jgi:hypothetical protein